MPDKSAYHSRGRAFSALAALAARQHGVVSAGQLYALGLSRDQISRRRTTGWLIQVHQGVYAIGHAGLTRQGQWMAALLALGETSALSFRSASALWRIWGEPRGHPVHVTVPSQDGRQLRRRGIVVHRQRALLPEEVTAHRGFRVTTPARTLLDLASIFPRRSLERAVDEAERLKILDRDEAFLVAENRHRPGARRLRSVLARHEPGSTLTRFELEELFLRLIRDRDLPSPLVNQPLLDCIPDFLWPEARLIAEVDGHESHGTRAAFQADRDRDSRLQAHGYRTIRFTYFDVTRRPKVVADRIRRALEKS